jgi:hypothetical protein
MAMIVSRTRNGTSADEGTTLIGLFASGMEVPHQALKSKIPIVKQAVAIGRSQSDHLLHD